MVSLKRFPRLNNMWVNTKHKLAHWRERRGRATAHEVRVGAPQNVLFVVIDCLRADHVSGFGHDRPTTPTLDSFDGRSFSTATATSTWTFPSIASLVSGRYPHEHGGRFDTDPRDLSSEQFPTRPRSDVPTLPELLESAGYDTAMVSAIPMAEKSVGDRFQSVDIKYTDATERVDAALDWTDSRDRWFLHLQLGDPHAPLDIPARHRERFGVPDVEGLEDWRFRESTDGADFEEYRDARKRAYDAGIRGADDELGRLFEAVPDDTIVVVCGDHGEAFWEHTDLERRLNDDPRGFYGTDHGHSVFEETATVPLWIDAPTVEPGRDDTRVSLVDVVPTVADALELENAPEFSGRPLSQDSESPTPILCEETGYGYNQRAVWLSDRKLIDVPETGTTVWFDLGDDPKEATTRDDPPADLREAYETFGMGVHGDEKMEVDSATRGRLEELGYLE
ncbi:arylsulfatase, choline-sulfatase [Haloferax mucosum ATCC BAA-1512]|uniref:Arylsulfatase, choline-sulfatase n=1 Tax=Haloferax mucosum ATCC BAA-1512 TaxID=662479 RepID=M0ISW5_9EURY|nr:sulfatase [Haloferax mucosum]ELZ98898.1 arylsulfatase, choline-sulfatase [Haloferax mucosum ATCC BAA-1512]